MGNEKMRAEFEARFPNAAGFVWDGLTYHLGEHQDDRGFAVACLEYRSKWEGWQASRAVVPSVAVPDLSALDAAFEAEIQRVSSLEYNSNEICRHFYAQLRNRLAAPAPQPGAEGRVGELELTDEMIDAACEAGNLYRLDFIRAWEAAIAKGGEEA